MNTTAHTVEPVLLKMIDVFRKEFASLSDGEKAQKQRINSLDAPCQIYIVSSPSKKFHLLIKTHFDIFPDKSIKLLELSNERYIEEIEEFYKIFEKMDEKIKTSGIIISPILSSTIQNGLIQLGKSFREGRDNDKYSGIGSMSLPSGGELALWNISGRLESINFISRAKQSIEEYKNQFANSQKEQSKTKPKQVKEYTPNKKKGFGTYFFPPIMVGEFNPTIRERIELKEHEILNENVIVDDFNGIPLTIKKEGLIGLQTEDRKKADNILHTIMGTATLMGIPIHAHKNSELFDLAYDVNTNDISVSSWSDNTLRTQLIDPIKKFETNRRMIIRNMISVEDVVLFVEKAKEIWKKQLNLDTLKLILNAFTHFANEEFSQSFILSWTIIELHLNHLWEQKLSTSQISNHRIKDLGNWDLYKITEILHLDRVISDDDYHEVVFLRGLRNELFHNGQEVTEKQSIKCYEFAKDIVINQFEINQKIDIKRYLTT